MFAVAAHAAAFAFSPGWDPLDVLVERDLELGFDQRKAVGAQRRHCAFSARRIPVNCQRLSVLKKLR